MTRPLACCILTIVALGPGLAAGANGSEPMLAHNVYFSLTDSTKAAKEELVAACRKYLSGHPGTVFFAAGTLAEDLVRPVNDRDFDVSLQIIFRNKAAHDRYSKAERHMKFIEENKANWKKVRVLDSCVGQEPKQHSMLYVRESVGSMDSVAKKLQEAVAANKFGVLAVHDLKQKMNDKGVKFSRACRIFEVCNPKKAKTVLEADMAISNALPCRISVYEEGGKVKVSTLKPTAVLSLFGRPELEPVAQEVEAAMVRIIDAACR